MSFSIIIWVVLVVIGVSDAKTHRIPNKLLIFLFALICISTLSTTLPAFILPKFLNQGYAFLIAFAFGFVMYLLRVMAPGDVKFIAVLGLFLGTSNLTSFLYYVCLATVFVGTMYWCLNRLNFAPVTDDKLIGRGQAAQGKITCLALATQIGNQGFETKVASGQGLTYMPFAPILVIGLALQQYYAYV